jgi:HEAT repeat protein
MSTAIDYRETVARLGHADDRERWRAYAELVEAGFAAAPAVREGLSHPDWRVRRGCALFGDHYPDPELLERLKLTLTDPKAKVRLFAVHALSCEPCKPGGTPVDAVPLLIRALKEDRAIRVRRHAANMLAQQPPERRIIRAFRWSLANEDDERLHRSIRRAFRVWGLDRASGTPVSNGHPARL